MQRIERQQDRRNAYRDWIERNDDARAVRVIDGQRTQFVRLGSQVEPDWYRRDLPTRYRTSYRDDERYYYRYDDALDQLYRIDRQRDVVRSIIPLYYSPAYIGRRAPSYIDMRYIPASYGGAYYPTSDYYYRSMGPAIYRVDPKTQLIMGAVALLTGRNFSVGSMMPTGYDVYNVPYQYRDTYYDRPDAWYRYDDGAIYQIDPRTRYVTDSYPLYGADYGVGQRWPTTYPSYNVPYGYQGLYYDTADTHYRYGNDAIYRIDPTTQVITALVSLVTGTPLQVGQAMPSSYGVYNVPYGYRDRFVEAQDRNYRYADGYVYAVDPYSGLITDSYDIYS
ncbi:hypothetical protein [Sphingomicrobium arenosum]|uniref:hypothetical protein n=1 Tax=Sphingomicrobium arenosum TaxID=2233861 RepID=UPI0022409870|nr:hypothetical protein [Sphingomicrobium arenosum]